MSFSRKLRTTYGLALLGMTLSGCALPRSEYADQQFVSRPELTAVSLAKDGMGYASQGRFIDAELNFLGANYLYPDAQNIQENLALVLIETQQFERAEKILVELSSKWPARVRYKSALARLHLRNSRYDLARKIYMEIFYDALQRLDPITAADSARSLSVLFFQLGVEESALCFSELALLERPDDLEREKHLRLLNATGMHFLASKLLGDYADLYGMESISNLIMWQYILALAGEQRWGEVLEIIELLLARVGLEQAVDADARLVKLLITEHGLAPVTAQAAQTSAEDGDQEQLSEAELLEEREKTLSALSVIDRIYWPLSLLLLHEKSAPVEEIPPSP